MFKNFEIYFFSFFLLVAQCSKSANTSEMLKNATTFVNAIVNTSDKGVNGVTFLSSACLVDLLSSEHLLKSKNKLAREAGTLIKNQKKKINKKNLTISVF